MLGAVSYQKPHYPHRERIQITSTHMGSQKTGSAIFLDSIMGPPHEFPYLVKRSKDTLTHTKEIHHRGYFYDNKFSQITVVEQVFYLYTHSFSSRQKNMSPGYM